MSASRRGSEYNCVDAKPDGPASEGRWISDEAAHVNRAKRRKLSQAKGLSRYRVAACHSTKAKIDQSRQIWAVNEAQTLLVSR